MPLGDKNDYSWPTILFNYLGDLGISDSALGSANISFGEDIHGLTSYALDITVFRKNDTLCAKAVIPQDIALILPIEGVLKEWRNSFDQSKF